MTTGLRDYSPFLALHTGKSFHLPSNINLICMQSENNTFSSCLMQCWTSGSTLEWMTSEDTSIRLQSLQVNGHRVWWTWCSFTPVELTWDIPQILSVFFFAFHNLRMHCMCTKRTKWVVDCLPKFVICGETDPPPCKQSQTARQLFSESQMPLS